MKTILFFISSNRHACRNRLEGICRYARTCDWHVQAVERATNGDDVREALRFWNPAGAIAECGNPAGGFSRRAFGKLPVVWFDAKPGSRGRGAYIGFDSAEAGRTAATKLIELGYEHFAYVSARVRMHWCDERRKAFDRELASVGRRKTQFFRQGSDLSQFDESRRMIDWLLRLPKPCGIFVANDISATRVLAACEKGKVEVPNDVSVISVDNDESICENTHPTLTSIAPDFVQGGFLAARLLNEVMSEGDRALRTERFGIVRTVLRESARSLVPGTAYGSVVLRIQERARRLGAEGASVADVVSGLGCTRRLAELRFRESTGKTILEALNDAAFDRACELIRSGVKPAALTCAMGGLSRSTLERIFRARTGLTPFAWARQCFVK